MNDTGQSLCIKFTDDEFFLLVAILHQINHNIKASDSGVCHSHAVFQFAGDSADRTGCVCGGYNVFRSLTGKVYDINLRKAHGGLEEWR